MCVYMYAALYYTMYTSIEVPHNVGAEVDFSRLGLVVEDEFSELLVILLKFKQYLLAACTY